jgi:chorismate dehydratase
MWDFEHPPLQTSLASRYQIDRMSPSQCADRLAAGQADIGLVPIAALAAHPNLRILPDCTIASKGRVRSLLLVHRAHQPIIALRSIAADTASRTTVAYARILLHRWGNPNVPFLPATADLDAMLDKADAAILIGDPALLALEEQANRFERTAEPLVYLDLAEQWHKITGLPFVSAVWGVGSAEGGPIGERADKKNLENESRLVESRAADSDLSTWNSIAHDFTQSRVHGLQNIDPLVHEWSRRLPIPEETIRAYLTTNIHYVLDEECIEGMRVFFRKAAELGILPAYNVTID